MDYIDKYTGGETLLNLDDLMRVQESNQSAINAIIDQLRDLPQVQPSASFVLAGLQVALSATIVMNAGYVYTGNGVLKVDAQSMAYNGAKFYHIVKTTTYDPAGDKTFVDGAARQTWRKERGVLTEFSTLQTNLIDVVNQVGLGNLVQITKSSIIDKVINIDDWDMVSTSSVNVAHGLSGTEWKTIKSVNVTIRDDSDASYQTLYLQVAGLVQGALGGWDATNILLNRLTGGLFDNTSFDSTSFNRGYITIQYISD